MSSKDVIMEILERLSRLEQKINDLDERIKNLESVVEQMMQRITSNSNTMKWVTVILAMILSFVAALFGLGWRPPS